MDIKNKMDIKNLIAYVRQANGMLEIIDKHRDNEEKTLGEIQTEWAERYSIIDAKGHSFYNQYQYFISLLAFIVIPRQNYWDKFPKVRISELPEKWGLKNKGDYELEYFIRRLRNSIVHAGVEISEDLIFTFTDINPKDNKDKFEVLFDVKELRSFVDALSNWIMNNG